MQSAIEIRAVLSGYSGRVLGVVASGMLASMGGRYLISPLLPSIQSDLAISGTQAGVALSVLWAFTALSQFPGGRLSDRLSRKTVLILSLALLGVGTVSILVSTTYAIFLGAVMIFGLGAGFYSPAAFAQISDLYPAQLGQAFGINIAAVNTGGVVAAGLAAVVITIGEWRLAFLPILGIFVLVLALMHHWNHDAYVVRRTSLDVRETMVRLATNRRLMLVLLGAGLFGIAWQALVGFLPTFLLVVKATSETFASLSFGILFVVTGLMNPVAGQIADRIGYPHISALGCGLSIVGATVIIAVDTLPTLTLGIVIVGVGLAGFWPPTNAFIMKTLPQSSRGGDFGAIRGSYIAIGSVGPAYVGVVWDLFSFTDAFVSVLVILFVSMVLFLWLARSEPGVS